MRADLKNLNPLEHIVVIQPSKPIKSILLRLPNWLGDSVMASPSFEWLKRAYKDARFTLVGTRASCGIYERDERVERIVIDETKHSIRANGSKRKRGSFGRLRATRLLAREIGRHDLAITFSNTFFAAALLYYSGSPVRIGYARNARSFLLTHALPLVKRDEGGKAYHQATLYLRLIAPLSEVGQVALNKGLDSIPPTLISKPMSLEQPSPRIGINAGAAYGSAKRWEIGHFVAVIESCLAKGYSVFLFGSSVNDESNALITNALHAYDTDSARLVDLTDKTTLSELLDYIAAMDIFISNDSGPMHIASALGVKLIALFGPTDLEETAPYHARDSKESGEDSKSLESRATAPYQTPPFLESTALDSTPSPAPLYLASSAITSEQSASNKSQAQSPTLEEAQKPHAPLDSGNLSPRSTHRQILLHHPLPCAPCKERECPLKHHNCMKAISPDEVIKHIENLLALQANKAPQASKTPQARRRDDTA